MPQPIEYADAQPDVRAVYDDIKRTRNVPDVNNFWNISRAIRRCSSAHGKA